MKHLLVVFDHNLDVGLVERRSWLTFQALEFLIGQGPGILRQGHAMIRRNRFE